MEISKCICDFSLIFIIYAFLVFPHQMRKFSHSIFGRALAILLIVYYSYQDVLYGLLFCVIVIFYYQLDDLQNSGKEGFEWEYQLESGKTDDFNKTIHDTTSYEPYDAPTLLFSGNSQQISFVEQNCQKGNLTKDKLRVNPEMREHVFPQLETSCNPCNKQCSFKILEERLRAENDIILPKNSNEWFDTIFSRVGPYKNL